MSDFLENLKKSVDEGTFNSEAAKKINTVDELAEEKLEEKSTGEIDEALHERVFAGGIRTVDEDEVAKLNSEYEEKMKERAKEEILLATVVSLIDEDEALEEKLDSLATYIEKLRDKHPVTEDETITILHAKMDELEKKYDLNKSIAG